MSPVSSQRPGLIVSAVAASSCQYPSMTYALRTWMSPSTQSGTAAPSGPRISNWTVGRSRPVAVGNWSNSGPPMLDTTDTVSLDP